MEIEHGHDTSGQYAYIKSSLHATPDSLNWVENKEKNDTTQRELHKKALE